MSLSLTGWVQPLTDKSNWIIGFDCKIGAAMNGMRFFLIFNVRTKSGNFYLLLCILTQEPIWDFRGMKKYIVLKAKKIWYKRYVCFRDVKNHIVLKGLRVFRFGKL